MVTAPHLIYQNSKGVACLHDGTAEAEEVQVVVVTAQVLVTARHSVRHMGCSGGTSRHTVPGPLRKRTIQRRSRDTHANRGAAHRDHNTIERCLDHSRLQLCCNTDCNEFGAKRCVTVQPCERQ